MQRVFVLSSVQTPLMPCHPARARELLKKNKASVFRSVPFTIILNSREQGNLQPLELKFDPGSKKTGLALQTKFNRMSQGFEKTHWLDAACVGSSGHKIFVPNHPGGFPFLAIKATGHGDRQLCLVDRYGFPRSKPSQTRGSIHGFRTGDLVSAVVPTGKKAGHYRGRVAVRASGSFNIKTDSALVQGISSKYCKKIMGCDGYGYSQGNSVGRTRAFLPGLKAGVSCLEIR